MDQDGLGDVLVRGLLLADAVYVLEVLPQGEARDAHDVRGHRCGEEQRLPRPLRGQHVEHLRDGGPEAHLQELVRLVEDHHAQSLQARLLKIMFFAPLHRGIFNGRVTPGSPWGQPCERTLNLASPQR